MKKKATNSSSHPIISTWFVWIFPLLALIVCTSLLWNYWQERGPTLKIHFPDASNIQVEKTKVRYRGVEIGRVKDVKLSREDDDAEVLVELHRDAGHMAVEGSKFWLVTPKVDFQGVSGLETIFTGSYIAIDPGPAKNEKQLVFKGITDRQSSETVEGTSPYLLGTSVLGSVSLGDQVTFRGLKVGTVTRINLDKDGRGLTVQINIQDRYTYIVRENTQFWRKVGIDAKLGLFKSEIKVNSLESLMHGGVEFATPDATKPMAKAFQKFDLNADPPKDFLKWNPTSVKSNSRR
jgi:paraquat-inducible protein B